MIHEALSNLFQKRWVIDQWPSARNQLYKTHKEFIYLFSNNVQVAEDEENISTII